MKAYFKGAIAGFVATAPMTVAMFALREQLPQSEKHPLPPEEVVEELVAQTGKTSHLSPFWHHVITWSSHFGFGAGAGTLYGPLAARVKAPPVLKGILFGLFVWAVSYLGWLPGTGILDQPKEQGARPTWLMVAAHIVWGATLGLLCERDG